MQIVKVQMKIVFFVPQCLKIFARAESAFAGNSKIQVEFISTQVERGGCLQSFPKVEVKRSLKFHASSACFVVATFTRSNLGKHACISVNFQAAAGQRKLSNDGERNTANTFDTLLLPAAEKRRRILQSASEFLFISFV